jgi:citrate synthase
MSSEGLEDVVATTSSITLIDGTKGRLLYRGYDINDLVQYSSYEETAFLLWNGRLPTKDELENFSLALATKRSLPSGVVRIIESFPPDTNTMDALRGGVACLGIFDDRTFTIQEKAASISSKMGTMAAQIHAQRSGGGQAALRSPRADLSFAANFLYTTTGSEPDEYSTKVMNVILILHADHELNASTFAARVVASTLSDVYSAITAAVGALKGPLHGGANEKVVEMVHDIGSQSNVERYVHDRLAKHQKVMGFGHRVYKTEDPRATILKDYARKLITTSKDRSDFEILLKLQEVMLKEKKIYANVDLFSGFVLNRIGIPTYLFTPVFAVGRTPGWLAHVLEQYDNNRLLRPVAQYKGPTQEAYIPLSRRRPMPA